LLGNLDSSNFDLELRERQRETEREEEGRRREKRGGEERGGEGEMSLGHLFQDLGLCGLEVLNSNLYYREHTQGWGVCSWGL
jgi:hypothetical protein